jgi:hypothetical protein
MLLVFLLSCESKDRYAGVYKAGGGETAKQEEIVLELKANGEGLWRVGSKDVFSEIPVVWYIRHGELRIDTKAGGVIVGKIEKDTIQISLPSFGSLTFRKTQ